MECAVKYNNIDNCGKSLWLIFLKEGIDATWFHLYVVVILIVQVLCPAVDDDIFTLTGLLPSCSAMPSLSV